MSLAASMIIAFRGMRHGCTARATEARQSRTRRAIFMCPHSQGRRRLRPPPPAGSFLGGFRTPANVYVAPSIIAGIRNPAQEQTHAP